jgi:hypothetical protein
MRKTPWRRCFVTTFASEVCKEIDQTPGPGVQEYLKRFRNLHTLFSGVRIGADSSVPGGGAGLRVAFPEVDPTLSGLSSGNETIRFNAAGKGGSGRK